MASGKSLRESIKDLENPASSVAFNDSEDEFTFAKVEDNNEEEEDQLEEASNFANLRKKTASYDDETFQEKKYVGSKISRKKIDKWSDDESEIESEDNELEDEGSEDENTGIQDADEEVESDEGNGINGDSDDDDDDDDDDEEDESEYLDSDDEEEDDGEMQLDVSKIPKDLLGDQKKNNTNDDEDDEDVENFTTSNITSEKRKGEATKHQLDLLDKLLESRIRLQKSMQTTNTLPQQENIKTFLREGGPQVKESCKEAKSCLVSLLSNLLKLQEELLSSHQETENILTTGESIKKPTAINDDEEILSDTDEENEKNENGDHEEEGDDNKPNLPSKRKSTLSIEDFEEELSKRHKLYRVHRDATIIKWYDKTRLMTGKSNKGFSGFETSTLSQIKQVMSDQERLLKRSQLKRTQYKILGKTEDETTDDISEVDSHLKNYDQEVFDDSDFYHEMLKELIERKSNISGNDDDDPIASGRRWLEMQKLRTKVKRKVDTRASKGRKVRYDVHSKLVSFMAPQDVGTMNDQSRNDLFSSLFGGMKTTRDVIDR